MSRDPSTARCELMRDFFIGPGLVRFLRFQNLGLRRTGAMENLDQAVRGFLVVSIILIWEIPKSNTFCRCKTDILKVESDNV